MIDMFPLWQFTYEWNKQKDSELKRTRGVCFDDVVYAIEHREIIDIIKSPLEAKYPNQWHIIITIRGYPHVVPFIIEGNVCFFKTTYANRKYKK